MNYKEQLNRYLMDGDFHNLVDHMYSLLMAGKYSVCELKDAAVFAANKFAAEQIPPLSLEKPQ